MFSLKNYFVSFFKFLLKTIFLLKVMRRLQVLTTNRKHLFPDSGPLPADTSPNISESKLCCGQQMALCLRRLVSSLFGLETSQNISQKYDQSVSSN